MNSRASMIEWLRARPRLDLTVRVLFLLAFSWGTCHGLATGNIVGAASNGVFAIIAILVVHSFIVGS
jgi:hypothetical protein